MRKLGWRAFLRITQREHEVPKNALQIYQRWLYRRSFVISLGASILTAISFPLFHVLTSEPGRYAFQGYPHRIAVPVIAGLCILLPLVVLRLRRSVEFFTFLNLVVLLVAVAVDASLSDHPRHHIVPGLIMLFVSTLIFTHFWLMTATYTISVISFVILNYMHHQTAETITIYAIAHFAAWGMAIIRIRSLRRISYDQARLYERRIYDQRVQLARDLHDSLGGDLMQLVLQLSGKTPRNQMLNLAHTVIARTKNLVHALDPMSQNRSFPEFVRSYGERLRDISRLRVQLDIDSQWQDIRIDHRLNLQAIFTEWMTNTLRHSRATEIKILLRYSPKRYYLIIMDNGVGFRWNGTKQASGLRNIAVRAELMNARVFSRKKSHSAGTMFYLRGQLFHD